MLIRCLVLIGVLASSLINGVHDARAATSSLPNGASSIGESYQDWYLSCTSGSTGNKCIVSQQILDSAHRRVLSVQFTPEGQQIHGSAVLPFGLDLIKGMTVKTSSQAIGDVFSFSTCLPQGCVVPLDLNSDQFRDLTGAPSAFVSATTLNGRIMKLPLSPKGLSDGIARARALMR